MADYRIVETGLEVFVQARLVGRDDVLAHAIAALGLEGRDVVLIPATPSEHVQLEMWVWYTYLNLNNKPEWVKLGWEDGRIFAEWEGWKFYTSCAEVPFYSRFEALLLLFSEIKEGQTDGATLNQLLAENGYLV